MLLDYTASDTVVGVLQELLDDVCLRQRLEQIIGRDQIQPVCDLIRNFGENQRPAYTDANTSQMSQNIRMRNNDRTSSVDMQQPQNLYTPMMTDSFYFSVLQLDQSLFETRVAHAPSDSGIGTHVSSSAENVVPNGGHELCQPENMGFATILEDNPAELLSSRQVKHPLAFSPNDSEGIFGTWPIPDLAPAPEPSTTEMYPPWGEENSTHNPEDLGDSAE
jgi:hypothetical protein